MSASSPKAGRAGGSPRRRPSSVPSAKRPPSYTAAFAATGDLCAKWSSRKRSKHGAALIRAALAERPWWVVQSVAAAGGDLQGFVEGKQFIQLLNAGQEDVKPVKLFPLYNPVPKALTTVPRGAIGMSPNVVDFATLLRRLPELLRRTTPET